MLKYSTFIKKAKGHRILDTPKFPVAVAASMGPRPMLYL